jgi:glycosyltransferase involved in cell wall biosynthesis
MAGIKKQSYAFVLPRYYSGLAGGAETLASNLAFKLAERGHKVEIFTTCAKDNRTWENHFPPGSFVESNVCISRFPVDERNFDSWIPKQISISQGMKLNLEDQLDWMKEGVNSKGLYTEIVKREDEFDLIFFAPYLFATTFWGSMMVSGKAVLIPCLHDEYYAYLDVIAAMFREAKGALFNAAPEKALSERLYGSIKGKEVGMGFELFSEDYLAELRPLPQISGPYILSMGRKETGKNVHLLIDYFISSKEEYGLDKNLKLVIAGGGSFQDLNRDSVLNRGDILDIGHIPEKEKHALMKNALLFCQPSVNESFSIVIMESWLLGVPCLVHSDCAVTSYHIEESGGGLHFRSEQEFAEAVKCIGSHAGLKEALASAGFDYVKTKYNWESVISRFYDAVSDLLGPGILDKHVL